MPPNELRHRYEAFQRRWLTLSFYERFEQGVALILAWLIAVIIEIAVLDLAREVVVLAIQDKLDPLDHRLYPAATILALAAVLLALGVTHWLWFATRMRCKRRSLYRRRPSQLVLLQRRLESAASSSRDVGQACDPARQLAVRQLKLGPALPANCPAGTPGSHRSE